MFQAKWNKPVVGQVGLQEITSCWIVWEWRTANNEVEGLYWYRKPWVWGSYSLRNIPQQPQVEGFSLAPGHYSTLNYHPYHPPGPSAIECLWARPKGDAALSIPFFDARNSADAPPFLSIDCKESKRSKRSIKYLELLVPAMDSEFQNP